MAAPFENFQQVQGVSTDGGKKDDVSRNDFVAGDQKPNIGKDHPRRDSDRSPQITHLIHPELNDKPYFLIEGHVKSKIEAIGEEPKNSNNNGMNMSFDLDLNPNPPKADENVAGDKLSSLIVMGCVNCFIYVMALKYDPECPKCKNTELLDVVGNLPKKN